MPTSSKNEKQFPQVLFTLMNEKDCCRWAKNFYFKTTPFWDYKKATLLTYPE